ncbi:MAG: GNAT family N-acetyltransferase [Bryobacterales bacterium]
MQPTIRPAEPGEMPAIRRLIGTYAGLLMQTDLPRTPSFFVAEMDGRIVGCCALQIYSQRLAEVRSLAVAPELTRSGIGSRLVEACKQRAKERGVKQVMAVTSTPQFFETLDFSTFKRERIALFHDVPQETPPQG